MEGEVAVNWTFSALEMLAEIHDYLSEFSETSADKYVNDLMQHLDKLKSYPEMCAPCKYPEFQKLGYRCCHFKRHIIFYEIQDRIINILAIIHEKRDPDYIET